jgi:hypothetical protein
LGENEFLLKKFSKISTRDTLRALEQMLSAPSESEPELGPDEDLRIYYDKETGSSRTEVVKKQFMVSTSSHYP